MDPTSVAADSDVDEFQLANIAKGPSKVIGVAPFAISPVVEECKTSQVISFQSSSGESFPSWVVLGKVVGVHISQTALKKGVYDTAAIQPVMRGGGPEIISL